MSQNRIINDKYYTPPHIAKLCIDRVYEVIGEDNISEIVEPSAGNGSFSNQIEDCIAYDIEPEHESIIQQDYLSLEIDYKPKRLIIGNPPFGRGNSLSVSFFKKSVKIADYIAFIQPISQLNNNRQMYDFDLIHSEDLGKQLYTDRSLHCCFNIYKRPESGKLNKKPSYKLRDVSIVEYRRGGNTVVPENYDYAMGTFGAGCVGKTPKRIGQYALECYFYIHNQDLKHKILKVLKTYDWLEESKGIAGTHRLPQWRICEVLKKQVSNIQ